MGGANTPLYDVREIADLKDMLAQSTEIYGDKAAFLVKPKEGGDYKPVSYKQFKRDVEALGTALIDLGLKGKRIAVIGENRYEWAVSYLAVINGVGTVVPLDKDLPVNEIENLVDTSEASGIIYSGKYEKDIISISANLPKLDICINMDGDGQSKAILSFSKLIEKGMELIKQGDRRFIDEKIDAGEMKILLFTSGTTGLAKGVMLSHKNICANLMAMCSMLYIDEKDIFLSVLPLHHTYECTCGFLCPIYRGSTIAYSEGLRHIAKNMKEAKATMMLGVPLLFESMHKKVWQQVEKSGMASKLRTAIKINNFLKTFGMDFSKKLFKKIHDSLGGHIRIFISGGAGIDPMVAKRFRELGFPLVQGYGLTECSPIVALNRDCYFKDAAAGLPLPGVEVKIDNPGDEGVGEIICKGENVMLGYYQNELATGKVIKDGWFHTGDLGFIDPDGFVHITGRQKNVIVTKNGKNIFPEEVESYLNRSSYIAESLVWGKYDEESGETYVNAQIVPNFEAIEEKLGKDYTDEQLYQLINAEVKEVNHKMPLYKRITDFTIRKEEFAKTTTKKIKRYIEKPEG
ncbi:AMP-dependent synthetase/ligase [Petroclostridium xylanilyticum]|uniref:AMP-dependent synthetase/ligase n=1 Tax=Petroclostridium xylanilyticum TaxID=1792311 RepID=UPI003119DDDC